MNVYNTMSRTIEAVPHDDPVTIYTCGPTVYSDPHIGNWRAFIFYDILVRALNVHGYRVERTMNLTDVGHLVGDGDEGEDKLQKAARKRRKTAWEVAEAHIKTFMHGMQELNMIQPDHVVRATDRIDEQIVMVKALEAKDFAYVIDDGVYFDTSKLKDYGKLAQLNIEQQQEGARVEKNTQKRNPSDFALWKFSPENEHRDMEWESPWGTGFPGWHLECSVIAENTLGKTVTIHTGGVDHIPVHHTNEIAQSEAANNQEFAKLWVHNEHMLVEGEKMSKSLENDFKLGDVKTKGYNALDFRTLILMAKYRTQQNFTWQSLDDAKNLRKGLETLGARLHQVNDTNPDKRVIEAIMHTFEDIKAAMANDLNTPEVLSAMNSLKDRIDQDVLDREAASELHNLLTTFDNLTGLKVSEVPDIKDSEYDAIMQRETLRVARKYAEADRIRDELEAKGIELNDTPWGAVWYYS